MKILIVVLLLFGSNQTTNKALSISVSNRDVVLGWGQSKSSNIAKNCVYRGNVKGGPYTQIFCSQTPITTYTDSTVTGQKTYYYVVTAIDSNQKESGYSNEVVANVP